MSKVIVIDWMIFVHRAIFAWRNNKEIPPEYTCLNMIVSCLRRIGIKKDDIIIIAGDGRRSWRKDYASEYKGNRKAHRDSFADINWNEMFAKFNVLFNDLSIATWWHTIKIEHIEADDIASVVSRYYKDKEIVLVSYDSDWEILWHYDNVKIFSPLLKPKRYKIPPKNFNAYLLISKKICKETSDNLISQVLTEQQYNIRKMCVDLLELPEFVEEQVKEKLDKIGDKPYFLDYIKFKTLKNKISNLFNDTKDIVTYDYSIKQSNKKKKKKRSSK